MTTLISLTISVTGLKGFDAHDAISKAHPDLVFNLDDFKFETKFESTNTPEEQIEGIRALGALFGPMINDLITSTQPKPEKLPHPDLCDACGLRPAMGGGALCHECFSKK